MSTLALLLLGACSFISGPAAPDPTPPGPRDTDPGDGGDEPDEVDETTTPETGGSTTEPSDDVPLLDGTTCAVAGALASDNNALVPDDDAIRALGGCGSLLEPPESLYLDANADVKVRVVQLGDSWRRSGGFPITLEDDQPTLLVLQYQGDGVARASVTVSDDADLRRIIVVAPDDSPEITGPPGVPIDLADFHVANTWIGDFLDGDLQGQLDAIEALAGAPVDSVHDCDGGTWLNIVPASNWLFDDRLATCDDRSDEGTEPALDLFASTECCGPVMRQSAWCATAVHDQVILFGLDDGARCQVEMDVATGSDLAWHGDNLYACDDSHEGHLVRTSLRTGAVEYLGQWCESVADWDGGLLLTASIDSPTYDREQVVGFASAADAVCDETSLVGDTVSGDISAVLDGSLYVLDWDDGVSVYRLPDLVLEREFTLSAAYREPTGLGVTPSGLLVVSSGVDGVTAVYDVTDGSHLYDISSVWGEGMHCFGGVE